MRGLNRALEDCYQKKTLWRLGYLQIKLKGKLSHLKLHQAYLRWKNIESVEIECPECGCVMLLDQRCYSELVFNDNVRLPAVGIGGKCQDCGEEYLCIIYCGKLLIMPKRKYERVYRH